MKRRRVVQEGYDAFSPNTDPSDFCPFTKDNSNYELWLEGWDCAATDYNDELERKAEEEAEWIAISSGCPWSIEYGEHPICSAIKDNCQMDNCVVYYFEQMRTIK